MVKKDKLLKDLKMGLILEEETIEKLSAFYLALGWKIVVRPEYIDSIKAGLSVLNEDGKKHAKMIKEMIKYVEESGRNEF